MPVSGASKKLCKGSSRTTRSSAPSAASRWREKLVRELQPSLSSGAFKESGKLMFAGFIWVWLSNISARNTAMFHAALSHGDASQPNSVPSSGGESYGPALWHAFSSAKLFSSCGLVFDASWSISLASCVAGPKESQVGGYEKLLVLAATCRNCYVVLPKKVCAVKHPMH